MRRTVAVLALAFALPATASAHRIVNVGFAANGSTARIHVDDVLTVSLPGAPSDQYRWFVESVNPKMVDYVQTSFYASAPDAVGPGFFRLAFEGVATGKSRLKLAYVPNGLRTGAALTFVLTVVVSKP
jgi:predicted secreted protein